MLSGPLEPRRFKNRVARWISTRQPRHKPVIEELGEGIAGHLAWRPHVGGQSFSPHCVKARKGNESRTIGSTKS
jgi:hypothetical protein